MTHPMWARSLVIQGGPWGRLTLPDDVEVTDDRELLQHGLITGSMPWQCRGRQLLVIQLGHLGTKNAMASGLLWEILLHRRDMVRAPTWLLVSDDPALDPGPILTAKVRQVIAGWRHIDLYDKTPDACDLDNTIPVPKTYRAPDAQDVDWLLQEQLDRAQMPAWE